MSDNVDASVDLHLLVKELHEVTEWYTLGALLGLTENEIKEIEQNHHETARRRMAMLSKWVKKDKNPSWLKIITALEEISETSLANQLREKYTATHQPRLSAKTRTSNFWNKLCQQNYLSLRKGPLPMKMAG